MFEGCDYQKQHVELFGKMNIITEKHGLRPKM